jgi:hypothetical protein
MEPSELKQQFKDYRESLHTEIQNLCSMISVIYQMEESRGSRFSRIAPAFFNYTRFSLGASTVIWASKLFTTTRDKREVNALKFMHFAHCYYEALFAEPYYSKRLNDSWPVTKDETNDFLEEVKGLVDFEELKNIRNRYYAHFEKKHLFDQTELFESNYVTLSEIKRRAEVFHEILMRYSRAFDGSTFSLEVTNIDDLKRLIYMAEIENG